MKKIIIKDMVHAIDLTIERHQVVVDGRYESYSKAKSGMMPDNWKQYCPLCEYAFNVLMGDCRNCPWGLYTKWESGCLDRYDNNKASITRLKKWRKKAVKLEEK